MFTGSIYCTLFLFRFCLWVYMYMCIFSHTFYYCYNPLLLHWAFAVLWSFTFLYLFSFFSHIFLFFQFYIFKIYYIFSTFIPLFAFPTVLFQLQLTFKGYKSYLPLFNFAYLFFLSFLSFFSLNISVLFSLLYSPLGILL